MRAPENSIFRHLGEKAAQIVDLFARLGVGGAGAPSAQPPLAMGLHFYVVADETTTQNCAVYHG